MLEDIPDDRTELRELDVHVARTVFGFRWVQWSEETARAKSMEYRHGRFLAPPDHPAAAHELAADPTVPRAPGWDRLLPSYTRQVDSALAAADHAGLFRRDVTIRHHREGSWSVRTRQGDGSEVHGEAATLPEALCLAVLDALPDEEDSDAP